MTKNSGREFLVNFDTFRSTILIMYFLSVSGDMINDKPIKILKIMTSISPNSWISFNRF